MNKEKILYLITGPIAAGKSTCISCLIDYLGLSSLEYISADTYYSLYFKDFFSSEGIAYARAKQYCTYKLHKAVSQSRSFIWETVVAKEKKLELIKSFVSKGYILKCLYIGTGNYNISIARVAQRHKQGWYTVPNSKTVDRHRKSMDYLTELVQLAESMIVIDNAVDCVKVVMWKEANKIQYQDSSCKWLPD